MCEINLRPKAQTPDEIINKLIEENAFTAPTLEEQCKNWWHSKTQQIDNGMIDTFTCTKKVCTDVILQRPYSLDELQIAIKRHCTGAKADPWYCGECEADT